MFDDLSEMFDYVLDVIKVSMSLMLFMSVCMSIMLVCYCVSMSLMDLTFSLSSN